MPKKVLIFESDAAFASELSSGLAQLGCETSVVDDANVGLQTAAAGKPDLILLSIELPRMNGFSVCNRIKRDAVLKNVPLLILSSDSTDETFEQHRRLRTRADDYIHKPIPLESLVERIRAFVPLGPSSSEKPADSASGIVLDEALVYEQTPPAEAELNHLADQVFEALLDPLRAQALNSGPPSEPAVVSERDIMVASARPSAPAAGLSVADTRELVSMRERANELERSLGEVRQRVAELEPEAARAARQAEQIEQLKRDLEESRHRLDTQNATQNAPKSAAGSAREVLELREVLNRKDKELLDRRDQLSHKDKELLALRDANLAIERQRADLNDRILEIEKQGFDLTKMVDALTADKEQVTKRADDTKRKLDRLSEDFEARTRELLSLRDAHEAEKVALKEDHQRALSRSLAELEQAAEQAKKTAIEQARTEAAAARERALTNREAELRQELDGKQNALRRAQEEALAKLKAELAQALEESEATRRGLESQLEHARAELGQRDSRISRLESELAERTGERDAARRKAEESARSVAGLETDLRERSSERDLALKNVAERDQRLVALQAELGAARTETENTRKDLQHEHQRWERAKAKWTEDRTSLEHAKDALAVALARIEEPEGRSLE